MADRTYTVTRAFQFKGGMWRPGATLRLSDAEAADPFVAAHVAGAEAQPAAPQYLGNGVLLPETPDARLMPKPRKATISKGK